MIKKKSWKDFKDSGMLWWTNRILHLFGWAIVFSYRNENDEDPAEIYPARCKFRGFSEKVEGEGFKAVSAYLKNNIDALEADLSE